MIEANTVQLMRAVRAIDEFVEHGRSLEFIQSTLESCRSLLGEGNSPISLEIFHTIEELEEVRFARLESEQVPEAVFLLDSLREKLQFELRSKNKSG